MDYKVDRVRKDVAVTLLGLGRSHAVYREGLGCYVDRGRAAADISVADGTIAAGIAARHRRTIGSSRRRTRSLPQRWIAPFAEPAVPPYRHTKAVVVVKDGRIVAERYAEKVWDRYTRSTASPRQNP